MQQLPALVGAEVVEVRSADLPSERLESMIVPAALKDIPRLASEILKGQVRGRVVVDVAA